VRPDGTKVYDLAANTPEYRTFRMRTLYEGISDQLAGQCGQTSEAVGQSSDPSSSADLQALMQPDSADFRRLDEFWAAAPWGLTASPEQSTATAIDQAVQAIPASAATLAPIAETDADPGCPDVNAIAAAPGCADLLTVIADNHASTSDDNLFGILGSC
jgi:hypothetical protein